MDGNRTFDVDGLRAALKECDHLLMRFETVALRLFVDFRSSSEAEPAVLVLQPVNSFRERLISIRRGRPEFPVPEQLQVATWPLRIGSIERLGVLDTVRGRLDTDGAAEALIQLAGAVQELQDAERDEVRRAISGEGYRTLWPSPRT
jgi:hypothetical protein